MICNITCLTPVKHIKNAFENLSQIGNIIYSPYGNYQESLMQSLNSTAIFLNPNKLTYRIDQNFINNCKNLKYIATASTGTAHIDLKYAAEKGIDVISLTKEYDTIKRISSTAEHAFGLMLALIRNIPSSFDDVKRNNWDYEKHIGRQVSSLTVGIVGLGRLGRMFCRYCAAMGAKRIIYDPFVVPGSTLEQLYDSDVISLHVHLKEDTRQMINGNFLNNLKNSPYIINTSRGEIVDEIAIIKALESGKIRGYATDVICDELTGNVENSPLIQRQDLNIIITPHIGGMTTEAQEIAYNAVIGLLQERLNDKGNC